MRRRMVAPQAGARPPARPAASAGPPWAAALAVVAWAARPAAAIQPRPQGHFLTNTELGNITAVSCLEAKQKDAGVQCENETLSFVNPGYTQGPLTAGNYPNYKDAACNSQGEFFCDPAGVLSLAEQAQVAAELRRLREQHPVQCGRLLNDPVDPRHLQPFYLGVALAKDWPRSESDPEALQQFGQIVASDWMMNSLYVGSPSPYLQCPNTAVLIVLPDYRTALLSAASCEFICQVRGGPEIATATLVALDRHGAAAGVLAGIREAYHVLANVGPRYEVPTVSPVSDHAAPETRSLVNFLQRAVFCLAVLALLCSLVAGFLVLLLAPGLIARRRK